MKSLRCWHTEGQHHHQQLRLLDCTPFVHTTILCRSWVQATHPSIDTRAILYESTQLRLPGVQEVDFSSKLEWHLSQLIQARQLTPDMFTEAAYEQHTQVALKSNLYKPDK